MKSRITTLALAATFAFAAFGGVALAASPNQATPGIPGDKNCVGQTTAFLAQALSGADIHGIGGLANAANLSVKEVKAIVSAYCNP